ncbi:16S rRNA (cytosine(1402)-N(4))-methyltransferase RsmH [bacterium]|nr:16S rRNA (cytosine(1402)-N(4))-methyltransferase RsmH [bacterium]
MAGDYHLPVLPGEVLQWLAPAPGARVLDGTLGGGGHAALILEAIGPSGQLYGIDQDPEAIEAARRRLSAIGSNVEIRRGNFSEVLPVWPQEPLDGILLDLGVSSHQLDTASRGFSFMREGPLDMRMDPNQVASAADLVNTMPERELADVIWRYGEERHSRAVARAIVGRRAERPFETTADLVSVVERVVPRAKDGIHPATRTFQGLRIAVNDELGVLERVMPAAVSRLKPGGRLAIISFHSLEDRMVKQFFRDEAKGCICPPRVPMCVCGRKPTLEILTSKPVVATPEENARNPRARSAKLRVARRI